MSGCGIQKEDLAVLTLERLVVLPDRIEAAVRVSSEHYRYTNPELISRVLASYPTLSYHACKNNVGPTFGAVMNKTPLPHLLEHLVIDIQTHEYAKKASASLDESKVVFTGSTRWDKQDSNLATVRVSFLDDLIALAAFKKALHFINRLLT
jgi:hypothetical protein